MIKKEKNRKINKIVKEDENKNKSFFKKNEKQIVGVFFLFMFILVSVVIKISDNNLKKRLLENPGYSIATIVRYTKAGGYRPPTPACAKVTFYANEKKIEKTLSDGVIRPCEPGSQYIILYNKKDPEEAWLLMEYRIIRDGDFQKYMEELKVNPPVLRR